jgi:hypothetical protein
MVNRQNIIDSFYNHESKKGGNYHTDGNTFFLHGNAIARHNEGSIQISLSGWNSQTTKVALNNLNFCNIKTIKGELTLNGKKINSNDWYDLE